MKVLARLCSVVIGALLLLSLSSSCATQNEGERCDTRNGDLDCDDGLKCTAITDMGQNRYSVCCWPLGTLGKQNMSAPCVQNQVGGGGGNLNEAGTADGAADGGEDTGTAE